MDSLKQSQYKVIVRPHPQQVRHMKDKFENMKEQYKDNKNIEIQTDFSSNKTVYSADLVITDWSSIANEFAYTTKKPVLFVDTPMKIMNPDYEKLEIEPINIWSRNVMGKSITVEDCKKIKEFVEQILSEKDEYKEKIEKLVNDSVYNIGHSAEIGADYIIEAIQNKINERKKEK